MRLILIALASVVLLASTAQAQEARRYADREVPALAEFRGGCPGPDPWMYVILIPVAIVVLPFYGLYKGGEALHDWICPPYQKKAPAPCGG